MARSGNLRTIAPWLRCKQCGALWYSNAAQAMLDNGENCLTCDGELELVSEPGHSGAATPRTVKRPSEQRRRHAAHGQAAV